MKSHHATNDCCEIFYVQGNTEVKLTIKYVDGEAFVSSFDDEMTLNTPVLPKVLQKETNFMKIV